MYAIYVMDETGRVYWVGDRASEQEAHDSADQYNRDAISAGTFFVEEVADEEEAA